MNTTLDLPESLVREIELRAAREGRQLTDTITDLLRKGLAASAETPEAPVRPVVKIHPGSGLPYIECPHPASAAEEMTPERVADLLLEQEVAWHHEPG